MNRELKFRVWSPLNKKMFPCYSFHTILKNKFVIGYSESVDTEFILDDKNAIVQQFTGLKDSKGIDIYEGDIVEHEYPEQPRYSRKGYENPNLPDNMSVIRWSRENEDNHPGFRVYDLIGQGGKIKVVGNIFENSEPLKDEN